MKAHTSCMICRKDIDRKCFIERAKLLHLKHLLAVLCTVDRIPNILPSEWDFLANLTRPICCQSCFDVLAEVGGLHELLENTKKSIKDRIQRVATTIAASERFFLDPNWKPCCMKLRKHFFQREEKKCTSQISQSESRGFKQELQADNYFLENVNDDDYFESEADYIDYTDASSFGKQESNVSDIHYQGSSITTVETSRRLHQNTSSRRPLRKPRQRGNPDNSKVSPVNSKVPKRISARLAEKSNHKRPCRSLCCGSDESEPEDGGIGDPDYDDEETSSDHDADFKVDESKVSCYPNSDEVIKSRRNHRTTRKRARVGSTKRSRPSKTHAGSSGESKQETREMCTCKLCGVQVLKNGLLSHVQLKHNSSYNSGNTSRRSQTVKTPGAAIFPSSARQKSIGESIQLVADNSRLQETEAGGKVPKRQNFVPFVIAGENLYLVRWGTFVTLTDTHLQCKAHECDFEVEKKDWILFDQFQAMREHIMERHRGRAFIQKSPHRCFMCADDKLYPNQEQFREHIRTHSNFQPMPKSLATCESCFRSVTIQGLPKHMLTHNPNSDPDEQLAASELSNSGEIPRKRFICGFGCGMTFKSSGNMKRHERTHLPKESRKDLLTCEICGARVFKDGMKYHMERLHDPDQVTKTLECPICHKKFHRKSRQSLRAHIMTHQGHRPYLCAECGASYITAPNLKIHILTAHGTQTMKKCKWCDKEYSKERSMRNHIINHHPEHYTSRLTSLSIARASGDEPPKIGPVQQFPCELCDTICKHRNSLKRHMVRAHSSDNPRKKTRTYNSKNPRKIRRKKVPVDSDTNCKPQENFVDESSQVSSAQSEEAPTTMTGAFDRTNFTGMTVQMGGEIFQVPINSFNSFLQNNVFQPDSAT